MTPPLHVFIMRRGDAEKSIDKSIHTGIRGYKDTKGYADDIERAPPHENDKLHNLAGYHKLVQAGAGSQGQRDDCGRMGNPQKRTHLYLCPPLIPPPSSVCGKINGMCGRRKGVSVEEGRMLGIRARLWCQFRFSSAIQVPSSLSHGHFSIHFFHQAIAHTQGENGWH